MNRESGFSLVEMLVTMVIAMVILGGLVASFLSQYGEYKYQNKRVDAVQDLELGIRFIADDLRLALTGSETITITNNSSSPNETTDLVFSVWVENLADWADLATAQANGFKAVRHYQYDDTNDSLKYDRNTVGADSPVEMLPNVTYFKVFQDSPGTVPSGYADAPPGLPATTVVIANGDTVSVSGYTILIEVSVDSAYKHGSFTDVRGGNHSLAAGGDGKKRVWRYAQVYPKAAI